MNILIVNDDGIRSENLYPLLSCLKLMELGRIYVCVPDGERSGNSHSTHKYSVLEENIQKSDKGGNIYIHTGTASDSIKFFRKFVRTDIDLVISGINAGFNLGRDIVYSGTVGAALEANMYGIRSMALSARKHGKNYWKILPGFLKRFIFEADWKGAMCLNINFPDQADLSDAEYVYAPIAQTVRPGTGNNDFNLCRNEGYITVTPLKVDLTDWDVLKKQLEEKGEKI